MQKKQGREGVVAVNAHVAKLLAAIKQHFNSRSGEFLRQGLSSYGYLKYFRLESFSKI